MDTYTTAVVAGPGMDARIAEDPSTFFSDVDDDAFGGLGADDSRHLSPEKAQHYGPVWQSMNVLAEDVAQLPLFLYQTKPDGSKERKRRHASQKVVHRRPNPERGPFDFWYVMMARALLWGNAYAWIERRAGKVVALWPIEPGAIYPVRKNGDLYYVAPGTGSEGTPEVLEPSEVFHLRGQGTCDLEGTSIVRQARELINGGMDAEKFGSRFFRNNARPDVVLEFPEAVDGETARNILKRWQRRHGGPNNAGRPGFLDSGGKVHTYGMSNEDSQWLQSRLFSKAEVAGWFKLPPHKIGHLERATFSNIEHQSIDYVTSSLVPWLLRIRDEATYKLLTQGEIDRGCQFEHNVDALLRGDAASRAAFYNTLVSLGLMTPNEGRLKENLNPLPGLDEPLRPLNMGSPESEPPAQDGTDDEADRMRHHIIVGLCRMLANAAESASRKPSKFIRWADTEAAAAHWRRAGAELSAAGVQHPEEATRMLFGNLKKRMLAAADGDAAEFTARVKAAGDAFIAAAPSLILGGSDEGTNNDG